MKNYNLTRLKKIMQSRLIALACIGSVSLAEQQLEIYTADTAIQE